MFLEQRKRYFPLPEYELADSNHVQLIMYGKLIDENYSRILIENQDLSIEEVMALDNVQKKREIPKKVIEMLKKKKLVEGRYPMFLYQLLLPKLLTNVLNILKTVPLTLIIWVARQIQ